jgi:O-antigen ligase
VSRPRLAAALLAALLPAGVLVMDVSSLAPYGPSKWAAVTTLGFAGAAAASWGRPLRAARMPSAAWLVFLLVVATAAAAGLDGLYAWTGTPERHFGFLTWLLCAVGFFAGQTLEDEGDARLVAGAAVAASAVMGAVALAEALGWDLVTLESPGDRLVGTLGSAAFLGAASALLVPVTVGVALDPSWSRRARTVAAAGALLGGVALVGSGARAAWVGVGAAVVVVAWARRGFIVGHARAVLGAGLAVVVALVAGGWALGVGARVGDTFDGRGGGRGRLDEWRVALRVVGRNPLLGVGPEGYRLAFAEGVDASYEREHGRSPVPDRAHNVLLDVALTAGIPGLLAYVGLLVAAGRFVLRALLRGPPWLAGVAAGVLAYGIQSLFLFPLAEVEPGVWLLAGVLVAHVATPAEQHPFPRLRPAAVALGGLAAVGVVAGLLDVAADRDAKAALRALDEGRPALASRHAERAVHLRPDAVRLRLAAARAHSGDGSREGLGEAIDDLAHAARVSPRDPVVRAEMARLLVEVATRSGAPADVRAARSYLETAVAADPVNAELQLRLGVAAALGGDDAAAERAWRVAERLAPRSSSASINLATAYARHGRWAEAEAAARRALARDPGDSRARTVLDDVARLRG